MVAMRLEQVQRFILAKKKHFGVMGTLKTSVNLTITYSNRFHSLFIRKNKKGKR